MRSVMKHFAAVLAGLLALLVGVPTAWASPVLIGFLGDASLTSDADMQAAMKIIFDDSIINSVVTDSEFSDLFEEGDGILVDQTTGGRYIETANMFGLPAGVGARGEGGYIPIPRGPKIVNGRVNLKKIMGSVEMSAETLKMVKSNVGAFLNWGERAMPSLVERVTNELDRMMLGYGAGIKARVDAVAPAVALAVDSAFGVDTWDPALLQFLQGESLVAGPNADGTGIRAGSMRIESIDFDAAVLNIDADGLIAGLADDDYLWAGDTADNSAYKESMGVLGAVDDGSVLNIFQNINRTTYPEWRSYVMDAIATYGAGTQLTETVLTRADDEAFTRGAAKIDTLVTSRLGLRQLWHSLKGDRQINDPRSYTGGKGRIDMLLIDRTITVQVSRKIPQTICFGLTRSSFRKWLLHRWEWDTTTGALWKQVIDGTGRKDQFFAYGSMYQEFGCRDPQKNFRVENFAATEPGTVV